MRRYQFLLLLPLLFLDAQRSASAQDVQVPAGMLLRCTLNEPVWKFIRLRPHN